MSEIKFYEELMDDCAKPFDLPSPPYEANFDFTLSEKITENQTSIYETPPTSPRLNKGHRRPEIKIQIRSELSPLGKVKKWKKSTKRCVSTKVMELGSIDLDKVFPENRFYICENPADDLLSVGRWNDTENGDENILEIFLENTQPSHHIHKQSFLDCVKQGSKSADGETKRTCGQGLESCARQIQDFRRRTQCRRNSQCHRKKNEDKKEKLKEVIARLQRENKKEMLEKQQKIAEIKRLRKLLQVSAESRTKTKILRDLGFFEN